MLMNYSDLWKASLGELETILSSATYKSFFATTKAGNCEGNNFEIICPSQYTADQINKRFLGLLKNTLDRIGKQDFIITFKIEKQEVKTTTEGLPLFNNSAPTNKASTSTSPSGSNRKDGDITSSINLGLSPKYTFDRFIVGPSNRLAHAIATGVAENPGKAYNPFFLYAGVGLGKTHLMQAIGNQIIANNPRARVVYCTAESFMNELIEVIQEGRNKNYSANKFREKFRKADILLIDDIQFIAGRGGETTQEEFFHTFNALYMAQKQIVLTSDRPPKELSRLDARITSRFSSGVVADMEKPDVETRTAILREKRDAMKANMSNEVVGYIAQTVETNIRELEGLLLQIVTKAKAEGVEITKDYCSKIIGLDIDSKPSVNVNDIIKTVCTYYNIKITDLKGKKRIKEFVVPRHVSMYMLKKYTGAPYMVIGDILGGRDHTTIMHGFEKIEEEIGNNLKLKQDVVNIKKTLNISTES